MFKLLTDDCKGIICYAIAFGIVMAGMGQKARVMMDFFQVLSDISMKMISVCMWCVGTCVTH